MPTLLKDFRITLTRLLGMAKDQSLPSILASIVVVLVMYIVVITLKSEFFSSNF